MSSLILSSQVELSSCLKAVLIYFSVCLFLAPCVDRYHDCKIYKPYCKHPSYKDFVEGYCKKTCDLCPKGKDSVCMRLVCEPSVKNFAKEAK